MQTATLAVRRAKKGGTPATHPIRGDELRALRRLQREQDPKSPFVFTSERGAPFTPAGFARMIEHAGEAAQLRCILPTGRRAPSPAPRPADRANRDAVVLRQLGDCRTLAVAVGNHPLLTSIIAAIPSRSAQTAGPMTCGYRTSSRGSSVPPAASAARRSGRTSTGTGRPSRRSDTEIPRATRPAFGRVIHVHWLGHESKNQILCERGRNEGELMWI
jgi:hypothetical protein